MRQFLAVTVMALSFGAPAALAQEPSQDFAKADTALNAAYREVENRLADDADGKARLVAAQRAWLTFRDAECRFQSGAVEGGSAAPLAEASCKAALTESRTEQLNAYLNCEEGDITCPVPPAQ